MKRFTCIVLTILVVLSLTSCGNTAKYKDGTYDAQGESWAYGLENATVTIEGGKISGITLRRLDTEGKEVNYEEWTGTQGEPGKLKPNLKKFRVDMANNMISKQSPEVDTISSATTSSVNWKLAVKRALEKAST